MDHVSPEEARPNLCDLVRINRYFGGHSVLRKTLESVIAPRERFTVLDVGAASGDAARMVLSLYPEASVTNLDMNEVNLSAAPEPKVIADAFRLPLAPASYDIVMSCLFLHHFEDEQVVDLLRGAYAVARRALIICDLERHILPYLFLPLTKPLFGWGHITVHDGIISVRASFRAGELAALARAAGIADARVCVHRPAFRLSLSAMKVPPEKAGGYSEEDTHRRAQSGNRIMRQLVAPSKVRTSGQNVSK